MTTQELRKKFEKETNVAPVFANREPYINYIEWLEAKILKQKKVKNNVDLAGVSKQRELLIGFYKDIQQLEKDGYIISDIEKYVDVYIPNL